MIKCHLSACCSMLARLFVYTSPKIDCVVLLNVNVGDVCSVAASTSQPANQKVAQLNSSDAKEHPKTCIQAFVVVVLRILLQVYMMATWKIDYIMGPYMVIC